MALVVILPEGVLYPVHADLDEHKEIPGLILYQIFHHLKALLGHLPGAGFKLIPVLGAEDDVKEMLSRQRFDLGLKRGRIGKIPCGVRADKAGDHAALYGIDRVGGRDTHDNTLLLVFS